MARPSNLEVQLTAVTQRFVAEVVEMIRHASVADVAGFDVRRLTGSAGSSGASSSAPAASSSQPSLAPRRGRPPKLTIDAAHSATGRSSPASSAQGSSGGSSSSRDSARRPRQTAERRAELGERVLAALLDATEPLGVRALAGELHVAPDLLSAPLLELRAAGKLTKHGEKRATTYAAVR
jgi:hypothetical protein